MLRRTSSQFDRYMLRGRARTLLRQAIGWAIFVSGFTVMATYLVRRLVDD
jgi:hypothetical protein